MKLGLIARADNSGLGIQSWEFARHMQPDRTLIIDVSHLADAGLHCNKRTFTDRYPGATSFKGWIPPMSVLRDFLQGLDTVFVAETPYNYALFSIAKAMGVRSVLQYNWEFLDYLRNQDLPKPSLFAAPSTWHYRDLPYRDKVMLPVPIATDRFTPREHGATAAHFVHIVGRPALHDRNGTASLLCALRHVTATVTVTMRCQQPGYVCGLIHKHHIHTPDNVTLIDDCTPVDNYWDNYTTGDVLIMPRRFGGLCLPMNEALGAGMPVIAPGIEPNKWLPSRWLVPARREGSFTSRSQIDLYGTIERALAAKIDEFATNATLFGDALESAHKLADELSWAALKPEYDRILAG